MNIDRYKIFLCYCLLLIVASFSCSRDMDISRLSKKEQVLSLLTELGNRSYSPMYWEGMWHGSNESKKTDPTPFNIIQKIAFIIDEEGIKSVINETNQSKNIDMQLWGMEVLCRARGKNKVPLEFLIEKLDYPNRVMKRLAIESLERLTNKEFGTPNAANEQLLQQTIISWKKWFEDNKNRLVWSEKDNRFVID